MRRALVLMAALGVALVLASGVALAVNKVGTDGPDVLRGTVDRDRLDGRGGADKLVGLGSGDVMAGGTGSDSLKGGGGDDTVLGGPREGAAEEPAASDEVRGGGGDDDVDGAAGADTLYGGRGKDLISDGENIGGAEDTLSGGDDRDFLGPRNEPAGRDLVSCGSGRDSVFADRQDVIDDDCEKVKYRDPTLREFNNFLNSRE